jgi:hypothetical protein
MAKKLTNEMQVTLVQSFARFEGPAAAVRLLKELYGVEISIQLACHYQPSTGVNLAPKWLKLFEETRAAFVANLDDIAVNHKAVRMRKLERYIQAAEDGKRFGLAAQLLRQAAEEAGGVLTNRRELTGAGGGPLVTTYQPVVELPRNGRDEK